MSTHSTSTTLCGSNSTTLHSHSRSTDTSIHIPFAHGRDAFPPYLSSRNNQPNHTKPKYSLPLRYQTLFHTFTSYVIAKSHLHHHSRHTHNTFVLFFSLSSPLVPLDFSSIADSLTLRIETQPHFANTDNRVHNARPFLFHSTNTTHTTHSIRETSPDTRFLIITLLLPIYGYPLSSHPFQINSFRFFQHAFTHSLTHL